LSEVKNDRPGPKNKKKPNNQRRNPAVSTLLPWRLFGHFDLCTSNDFVAVAVSVSESVSVSVCASVIVCADA